MKKILFTLGICYSSIFADTITFDKALKETLNNNHELKVKQLEIEKSKADLQNARGMVLGELKFNENISRSNNPLHVFGMKLGSREADFGDFGFADFLAWQQNGMQGDILTMQPNDLNHPEARKNYETKLSYQLPLFTGFKLSSAQDMAKLQVKANTAKYNYDKKQLSLEVLKAYNGAVAAKYFISATQKAKKATSSFVNFANEMHKEGYVTQIDIDQASVYDLKIDAMLLEAKNKFALAIAYLKFLTNNKTITDVNGFQNLMVDNTLLEKLQNDALAKRDDLEWMQHNTQTMKEKINFEKSGNLPMIGAYGEYGYNDNQFDNLNSDKDYYTFAVGLEYKLFDGLTTSSNIEKAKIEYAKMNHYTAMMEDGIKLQVEKAYLNLKTKNAILEQKQKAQNLAFSVLEKSEELYKNQLIKMNDLLLEQANAQKAEAETIMAKYEQTIAVAELQLATGNSLE